MKRRDDIPFELFRRFELFNQFDEEELGAMAKIVEYRVYDHGEEIVAEGECNRDLYLLTDGEVEIRKSGPKGGDHQLAVVEPEAVLGELGLVLGEPRSATALAASEAHLLRLAGEPLIEQRRDGSIAAYKLEHNILRSLARRQSDMNARMMEMLEATGESEFQLDEVADLREQLSRNWSF